MGFDIILGNHPIVPVMPGDELKAASMATELNQQGIFVVEFIFPVTPWGQARIRVQLSAAHSREYLNRVLGKLEAVGNKFGSNLVSDLV